VTLRERFEAKFTPEPMSGCWLWTGAVQGHGYGCFHVGGQPLQAHRMAWQLTHGSIAPGIHVLHRCDNPACVNPSHLFLGDPKINAQDRSKKGRGSYQDHTHCKQGHPFSGNNLFISRGFRRCRACARAWDSAYRERKIA
jgi:hypothetical protein